MSRFLLLDIGAGTLDLLWYDTSQKIYYKAVCRSPVLTVAERAGSIKGDILVTGREMGGGALGRVLKEKAGEAEVVMSASAAATVHHDPDRVRALGVRVEEDEKAESLLETGLYTHLRIGDIEAERLSLILEGLGVPFDFDVLGVCAQDHGVPPKGVSHLDFRQNHFSSVLDRDPSIPRLLYRDDQIPAEFNRLRSIAADARALPVKEVFVMDSGMAAVLGASLDPEAASCRRLLVLDVATSHTLGAALEDGELCGFFEYHTSDITKQRLESLLPALAEGVLIHADILREGGHGAYVRRAFGFGSVERIVATGPRRGLLAGVSIKIRPGAPLGDHMMTGALGLMEAVRLRKGLGPLQLIQ